MSDDLLKRLSRIGERVSIPCPDNIRGCLVFHYRVDTDPTCVEAIDEIKRLRAENEQLRGWAGLAKRNFMMGGEK